MRYIQNGTALGSQHAGQVGFSLDNTNWQYFTKHKIKEISGTKTFVRLLLEDNTRIVINLLNVLNQPTWSTGNAAGLSAALNDLSSWVHEDQNANIGKLLTDIKKYQHGSKGYLPILPAHGLVNGNFYLVRAETDTVFTNLTEKGVNLVTTTMNGITVTENGIITTSDLDGNGFTSMQISSGEVWAYLK